MGSVQSYLSSQTTTVVLVVAGVVTYTVAQKILQHQFQSPSPHVIADSGNISVSGNSTGKKSKKKKHATGSATHPSTAGDLFTNVQPTVVAFPEVIPGGFEPSQSGLEAEPSEGPKSSSIKPKKKKGKKTGTGAGGSRNLTTDVQSDSSATAPESHISSSSRPKRKSPAPKPTPPSTSLLDTDGPWTRVESKKRNPPQQQDQLSTSPVGEGPSGGGVVTTSDAGITTSVTGNSSSVADPTEDESQPRQGSPENRRTLAEKLVPKPRKTGVDDMLETPDVPTLARVMRVQPRPDEQPVAGFTWADYEDVDDSNSRMTADDADGEDEGGWVVKNSRSRAKVKTTSSSQPSQPPPQHASETLTKKQRQNIARREAQKEAKAAAESERVQMLAKHKRELEKTRMLDQHASGSKKQPSGGMKASMNEKGQLVWE